MNGIIFSIDFTTVFYSSSNFVVKVSKRWSLRSLGLDVIWIKWGYLVDIASLTKLSLIRIFIYSLNGKISTSMSIAGLDVALYSLMIIRMAFVYTNSKAAKWIFWCFFLIEKRYYTEHSYISYCTITTQYIWLNFQRLSPDIYALSLAFMLKLLLILFLTYFN